MNRQCSRRTRETSPNRGLSPVVGVVLLVAITVVLAALSGSLVIGLGEEQSPAPTVSMELESADAPGTYLLVHEEGNILDGDQVRLRDVADPDTLAGRELGAGQSATVQPTGGTVEVVWFEAEGDSSHIIAELEVPESDGGSAGSGSGSSAGGDVLATLNGDVFATNASGVLALAGDGGDVAVVPNTSGVAALGNVGQDVTGDGDIDVPFADAGGTVSVVDGAGDVTALADSSDISGSVATSKTRLAAGSWDGSPVSVFFVDQNHDTIYRVAPGGSPVAVESPGNGAQAVVGVADVDGDGTDELLFADASQHLRYLEPGGSVVKLTNGGAGSNNGIGTAALADLDGDGVPAVVFVDGSNDVVVNREASGGGTTTITLGDAAKSPPTATDVDGDGDLELVYVSTGSDLKYVDDVGGSNAVRVLADDAGDVVEGSDETGTT